VGSAPVYGCGLRQAGPGPGGRSRYSGQPAAPPEGCVPQRAVPRAGRRTAEAAGRIRRCAPLPTRRPLRRAAAGRSDCVRFQHVAEREAILRTCIRRNRQPASRAVIAADHSAEVAHQLVGGRTGPGAGHGQQHASRGRAAWPPTLQRGASSSMCSSTSNAHTRSNRSSPSSCTETCGPPPPGRADPLVATAQDACLARPPGSCSAGHGPQRTLTAADFSTR